MAKLKPELSLEEMENAVGFKANALGRYQAEDQPCWYFDLRPVPTHSVDERMRREADYHSARLRKGPVGCTIHPESLLLGDLQDECNIKRISIVGSYQYLMDIHFNFGLQMRLQPSNEELNDIRLVAKTSNRKKDMENLTTLVFNLPREVRNMIYYFSLPDVEWVIDHDRASSFSIVGGIGDPSGFHMNLPTDLALLVVSRQIREECLPLVYQEMTIQVDDLADLVRLLIAIGEIGRANIQVLRLRWESQSDCELRWESASASVDPTLMLPTLHTEYAVHLLKQCKRLSYLCLYFEEELLREIAPKDFKTQIGIEAISSIGPIETVEVRGLDHEPLEECDLGRWLEAEIMAVWDEPTCERLGQ